MQADSKINPAVLTWARETAGLSLEEGADRIGLSTSAKSSAADKLEAIERGDRTPTEGQLAKMASVYHRPLLALYMTEPPRPVDRGEDFRTGTGAVPKVQAARLDALVSDVRVRQGILNDIIAEDEDAAPLTFIGSMSIATPLARAVAQIKRALGVDDDRAFRTKMRDPTDLFAELRRRTEALGVFVILLGDLGHHTKAIASNVFRGFAVADKLAPLIVINDQDAKAAWSFTLIHELVHIFVGSTGVSGAPTTVEPHTPREKVERFCNDVAGEVLLPSRALTNVPLMYSPETLLNAASHLADLWKVSPAMAAYRLWRNGKATADVYSKAVAILTERWRRQRDLEKSKSRDDDGGPSYYVIRRHRLGESLLQLVGRSLRANIVTNTTAAKVLGVRPGAVDALLAGVKGFGGRGPERRRA